MVYAVALVARRAKPASTRELIHAVNFGTMLKNRAKDRSLPFDLKVEDIVIPESCPMLGISLKATVGKGRISMKDNWNAPTLDRIDSTGGYTKGNVMVISARANFLKNNATLEEMRAILWYMEKHCPS